MHGTVSRWNDQRGFGFVTLASRDEQVFVHVSAFPRDGEGPRVGELVSFRVVAGPDGRKRAIDVMRSGVPRLRRVPPVRTTNRTQAALWTLLVGAAICAVGVHRYGAIGSRQEVVPTGLLGDSSGKDAAVGLSAPLVQASAFKCDNRTRCWQMNSCEEARFFLENCGHVNIDGDLDGVPCEDEWCGKQ